MGIDKSGNEFTCSITGDYSFKTIEKFEQDLENIFGKAEALSKEDSLTIKFELHYLTSHAKHMLFSFVNRVVEYNLNSEKSWLNLEWRHESDDEDIQELGEIFQDEFRSKGLGDRFKLLSLM